MHHSIPTHHNRYINHTHSQPLPLARPSFPPFQQHPQIPNQHFNPVPNHVFQGPTHIQPSHPFQTQKLPPHGPIPAQRWEDIIPQTVVNQPIMRPNEQTLTFRGNATGSKPSNKELLAKADLILARSPPRQNTIPQAPQPRISAHKEQPRNSYHSHQPAQTLQTFASPRPGHLETFTSPVRNAFEIPRSVPGSLARTHTEFPPHAFVSPPREQLIRTLPTEYHTSPPQHIFHAPPPHFIGPNIIRHEVRPEMIPYQIPNQIPTEIERPVPLLKPAPRPGQVHHMPLESAQFPPTSELSEIRRDFAQLRLETEPQQVFETMTPTPLRIITEDPVSMPMRMLEFVPEIMEDEEASDYIPQIFQETDRGSHGRNNKPRNNKLQKKLIAEPYYEKQQQNNQPNLGKRFNSGQQSGGSSARRNPYRKNSNGNNGQLMRVPRDTQAGPSSRDSANTIRKSSGQFLRAPRETQTAPGVTDTERTNRKSSISEYIEERPRITTEERPRVTTPTRREGSVQTLNFSPKAEPVNAKKEEETSKNPQAWIYSPNSERANVKKEESPKEVKTWIYSPNSERVNEKKEEAPKDVKTWIYTPSTESVRRQESPETKKKEREAKYTNKVEVSLTSGNQQGTDVKPKNRKMMKKVEEVLF